MNKSKLIIIGVSVICGLVIIFSILILGNGTIYNRYKCPDSTYKLENRHCKKTEIIATYDKLVCPNGYEVENSTCVKKINTAAKSYRTCEKGFTLDNQSCIKTIVTKRIKKYTCIGASKSPTDESKCVKYESPLTKQQGTELVKYCNEGVLKGNNCVITSNAIESSGCPDNYEKTAKQTCTRVETSPAKISYSCDNGYTLDGNRCIKTEVTSGTYEKACNMDYIMKDDKCYRDIDIIATKAGLF